MLWQALTMGKLLQKRPVTSASSGHWNQALLAANAGTHIKLRPPGQSSFSHRTSACSAWLDASACRRHQKSAEAAVALSCLCAARGAQCTVQGAQCMVQGASRQLSSDPPCCLHSIIGSSSTLLLQTLRPGDRLAVMRNL